MTLPGDFDILLMNLLDLDMIEKDFHGDGTAIVQLGDDGSEPTPENSIVIRQVYRLTDEGAANVEALRQARDPDLVDPNYS